MATHFLTSYAWYEDDYSLHLDVPAMLREMNVRDTPANRETCVRLAQQEFARLLSKVPQTVVEKG